MWIECISIKKGNCRAVGWKQLQLYCSYYNSALYKITYSRYSIQLKLIELALTNVNAHSKYQYNNTASNLLNQCAIVCHITRSVTEKHTQSLIHLKFLSFIYCITDSIE